MQMSRSTRMVAAVILGCVLHLLNPGHVLALKVGDKASDFFLPATRAETVSWFAQTTEPKVLSPNDEILKALQELQ